MDPRNGGDADGGAGAACAGVGDIDLKQNVEELVTQERIVIFSKESCPYCYDAKNVRNLYLQFNPNPYSLT